MTEPPDVDQILRLAAIICEVDGNHDKGAAALAEAILSHRGWRDVAATPAPVPVAERLPKPSDYKGDECWWWNDDQSWWEWGWYLRDYECRTHWLPHWALPLPEVQP